MGVQYNSRIVTDGLVLALDAANPKNYNLTAVEVLVVAGGGGGGGGHGGGGGGAGGLIYNSNFTVTPGSALTVTVGGGGAGGSSGTPGNDGSNSIFGSLTATGGGGGGGENSPRNGRNGGSGGGGSGFASASSGGSGTSNQGNIGGGGGTPDTLGGSTYGHGGGGGGAGASGTDGTEAVQPSGNVGTAGVGGSGLGFNISGTFTYYAGGGGGGYWGSNLNGGAGGLGGGGRGGDGHYADGISGSQGQNGTANTGGGGGGSPGTNFSGDRIGGNGGSGIVIVRYPGPQKAIGGTVTSVGGHTIHTFTTVGSTTFTPLVATNNSAILGLADFSGRNNFGETVNSPTYSSANGGSVSFDGSNDYISTNIGSYTPYCIDIWFYNNDNITSAIMQGNYQCLLGVGNSPGGITLGSWTGSATDETFCMFSSNWSTGGMTYITDNALSGNHNLVVNWNGSSYDFWLDGIKRTSYASSYGHCVLQSRTILDIGRDSGGVSGYYFDGKIYSLKIYTTQLTDSQISQNFNALRGRFGI